MSVAKRNKLNVDHKHANINLSTVWEIQIEQKLLMHDLICGPFRASNEISDFIFVYSFNGQKMLISKQATQIQSNISFSRLLFPRFESKWPQPVLRKFYVVRPKIIHPRVDIHISTHFISCEIVEIHTIDIIAYTIFRFEDVCWW